jgi:hypothetical protein
VISFKKFDSLDRRILTGAAALVILSTLLNWADGWIFSAVSTNRTDAKTIGQITKSDNDVRRRREIDFSWIPLANKQAVYEGDSIFTGDKSGATIKTESGSEINIAPNSLVVVSLKSNSISLDIGFGSVESRIEKGKTLLISLNNTVTEVTGDGAVVKVDAGEGNKILLNVISGKVNLNTPDGQKSVDRNQGAEINLAGHLKQKTPAKIELIQPIQGQRFKNKENLGVLFKWQTNQDLDRMKIKVATDKNFTNVIADSRVGLNNFTGFNLPSDQTVFWQIQTEIGTSEIGEFVVVGSRPPILVLPKNGQEFYYEPMSSESLLGTNVDLKWTEGSKAKTFGVQVASDPNFTTNLQNHTTKLETIQIPMLTRGLYFWRVKSLDFPDNDWSQSATFSVGPAPNRKLPAPVLTQNTVIHFLSTAPHELPAVAMSELNQRQWLKLIENPLTLRWQSVQKAQKYSLQVANDPSFKTIVASTTTTSTNYRWSTATPGLYYFRVRAINSEFADGLFSATQRIEVGVAAPLALSKPLVVDEVPDRKLLNLAPPPLKLKWLPTVFSNQYEIEFSDQSDFQGALRTITSASERLFQVDKPGIFYWRVRALNNKQIPVSEFSGTYTLEFQRMYRNPRDLSNLVAINPKQQDSIIMIGADKSQIDFLWSNPFKGAKYRLELAQSPDFEDVFFTKLINGNQYSYDKTFPSRVVYWRVRAENKDFVSQWTGANRFLITYENKSFSFQESDQLFAARIKAKDRQEKLLALQRRRILELRSPAAALVRLDQPQLLDTVENYVLVGNFPRGTPGASLARTEFDNYYAMVTNLPVFKWTYIPATERYFVTIAADPQFRQVIESVPAWDPVFVWEQPRPGKFYYRVQAFNERYERSLPSTTGVINVKTQTPVVTSQDTFVELHDELPSLSLPPSPITLTWTPVIYARNYEILFSDVPDFSSYTTYIATDNFKTIRVPKNGTYYWRVRATNRSGVAISDDSPTRAIEVVSTSRTIASDNTLAGLFPIKRTMVFVGSGLMNLAFHWMKTDQSRPTKIEVATDKDFLNVIATDQSTKTNVMISKVWPAGKLFWRLSNGETKSPTYEFVLRQEKRSYFDVKGRKNDTSPMSPSNRVPIDAVSASK